MPSKKQPRYSQIADLLRAQIQGGALEIGDRLPSFVDMYREHGATTATMQKAYSELENEGFIERRSRSGIYVAGTQIRKTGTLALVFPYYTTDYQDAFTKTNFDTKLQQGLMIGAMESGFQLKLLSAAQVPSSAGTVDGFIVQGLMSETRLCSRFSNRVISLFAHPDGIPSVGVDDCAASQTLTQHLIDLGHRRIAALLGNENEPAEDDLLSPQRIKGYSAALEANGLAPDVAWHRQFHRFTGHTDYSDWAFWEMNNWLNEGWRELGCTAIVTQNDSAALGVIKALRQNGYRVPQDVSVTGFDATGVDAHFDLKLTTMRVPLEDIGRRAAHLLNDLLEDAQQETPRILLETNLVKGESAGKAVA